MRKLPIIGLPLLTAVPLLASCNTTAGAGKDISNAGQAIENSAEKHAP
jgi:predicted small secreted protein